MAIMSETELLRLKSSYANARESELWSGIMFQFQFYILVLVTRFKKKSKYFFEQTKILTAMLLCLTVCFYLSSYSLHRLSRFHVRLKKYTALLLGSTQLSLL